MPLLHSSPGGTHRGEHDPLIAYRPWFYAAALYNVLWGSLTILFPQLFFQLIHVYVFDALPLRLPF